MERNQLTVLSTSSVFSEGILSLGFLTKAIIPTPKQSDVTESEGGNNPILSPVHTQSHTITYNHGHTW